MTLFAHQSRRSPWWRSLGQQAALELRLLASCTLTPIAGVLVIAFVEIVK